MLKRKFFHMKKNKSKSIIDILSMLLVLAAIVSGFVLHKYVWHFHIYSNKLIWYVHEIIGLSLIALITIHCIQHSFWFRNFTKIPAKRRRVTTIFLVLGGIVGLTGVILMCGSRSETISHIHYIIGILFTFIAVGHVIKRWKIFRSLL